MKKLLLVVGLASLAVFSVGCGGSPCAQHFERLEEYEDKACSAFKAAIRAEAAKLDEEVCEEDWEDGSDREREKMQEEADDFAECVRKLDECEEGEENEWAADVERYCL